MQQNFTFLQHERKSYMMMNLCVCSYKICLRQEDTKILKWSRWQQHATGQGSKRKQNTDLV